MNYSSFPVSFSSKSTNICVDKGFWIYGSKIKIYIVIFNVVLRFSMYELMLKNVVFFKFVTISNNYLFFL